MKIQRSLTWNHWVYDGKSHDPTAAACLAKRNAACKSWSWHSSKDSLSKFDTRPARIEKHIWLGKRFSLKKIYLIKGKYIFFERGRHGRGGFSASHLCVLMAGLSQNVGSNPCYGHGALVFLSKTLDWKLTSPRSISLKTWRHALRLVNYARYWPQPPWCPPPPLTEIQLWPWLVASARASKRDVRSFSTTYPIKSVEWYARTPSLYPSQDKDRGTSLYKRVHAGVEVDSVFGKAAEVQR